MDVSSPLSPGGEYQNGQPMDIQSSPMVQEYPNRPQFDPDHPTQTVHDASLSNGMKPAKLPSQPFGKKSGKWGLGGFFGHADKTHQLPPVDEVVASSASTPSLKRTQSISTDSSEMSPANDPPMDPKKIKKEAERVQREAEKQRRALAEKMQREQARAVINKRNQMLKKRTSSDQLEWEWKWSTSASLVGTNGIHRPTLGDNGKGKAAAAGPIRGRSQERAGANSDRASKTVNAAAGRYGNQVDRDLTSEWRRDNERSVKVRRREFDDDHSMSSSDVHSNGRLSAISFATVDSDPGPALRHRPSVFGISRMTSTSSLRTSFDDFPTSARSSNSFSLEQQLVNDFHRRACVDPHSPLSGSGSPPPMHSLSLSPSLSPSPTWVHHSADSSISSQQHPPYIAVSPHPPSSPMNPPQSPFEFNRDGLGLPPPSPFGHPPSPGNNSVINPIFKVVSNVRVARTKSCANVLILW
jgi:hypothetical protein